MGTLVGGVTLPLSDADLYGMSCTMNIDLDREKIKVGPVSIVTHLLISSSGNILDSNTIIFVEILCP